VDAGESLLVEEIIHYARLALEGGSVEKELMLDALAELLNDSDTVYVEGSAALAARKTRWGYEAAADETLLRRCLELIASPDACSESEATILVEKLAHILGVDPDAKDKLVAIAGNSCQAARHIVGLLLLVPPSGGASRL
jgi:hypothetical protein